MSEMKYSGIEWIGNIPKNWIIERLKYLKNNEENSFVDGDWIDSEYIEDSGIRYYTTGNIGDGIFKEQSCGFISERTFKQLKCKYMYPGDLIFSRLNAPYGRSCILPKIFEKCVIAVDNVVLRTNHDKKFLCYITQTDGYHKSIEDYSNGATMQRISRVNLGNVFLPIPSIKEQRAISNYLDNKIMIVDNIISDLSRQIELLGKYKISLINEIVTKGLNKIVKYKETNVEWMGNIPEHWNYGEVGFYTTSRSGGTPDRDNLDYWENGTIPWMASGEVNKVNVYDTNEYITEKAIKNSSAKVVPKNSVMVALNGQGKTKGMSAILKIDAACNQSLCAFQCGEKLYYKYLFYNFQAMYRFLRGLAGEQRDGLAASLVKKQKVLLPPIDEQKEIANYLDKKCSEIDEIINSKNKQKEQMEQYKKSVIYEYVTGKKRVEGAEELYG